LTQHSFPTRRSSDLSPDRRIKPKHGNSPLLIGLSVNTGTTIKQPTKMLSLNVVQNKLPGISCLRTRNGLEICSWQGPSFTPCVKDRKSTRLNSSHQI